VGLKDLWASPYLKVDMSLNPLRKLASWIRVVETPIGQNHQIGSEEESPIVDKFQY